MDSADAGYGYRGGSPAAGGLYGTTSGGDQMGAPLKYLPANYAYGAPIPFEGKVLQFPSRKRMNVVAVTLSLFMPWVIFMLVSAMLSFSVHYKSPGICSAVVTVLGVLLTALFLISAVNLYRSRMSELPEREEPSWSLFLYTTALVALILAVAVGNENFWSNMEPYYDVVNLNTYADVDPARVRGQEIMDAGRVTFVAGSRLDLNRSMGFKNMETFCIAPITSGSVEGNAPLASYDFFAVGKDCCTGNSADFKCDAYDRRDAKAGVRLVRDGDRAFYRLAVQQAQSAYSIKATHPLFFHWVLDPVASTEEYRRSGLKMYLLGMFGHFGFQLLLVAGAVSAFSKLS